MTMPDDIAILLDFYARCGPEVSGRGLSELLPHQSALIQRFIIGHCDEVERREVAALLVQNPSWIQPTADRIKASREGGASGEHRMN